MESIGLIYLTKNQIIKINQQQTLLFGGNFVPPYNLLHEENLDYLIEIVQAEMFGKPLYPYIYQKAGVYMHHIVCNHIFQDGNKRTGLQSAMIFLLKNGYDFIKEVNDEVLINFTLDVASAKLSLEEVQTWFEKHISKNL